MKMKSAEQWLQEMKAAEYYMTDNYLLIFIKMVQLDAVRSVDVQSNLMTLDDLSEGRENEKVGLCRYDEAEDEETN